MLTFDEKNGTIYNVLFYLNRYVMNRKLILIAVAVLGVLGANVSEAKVCRLGDADCGVSEFYGTGGMSCSSEYKPCDMPRIGATYCKEVDSSGNIVVKYG